MIHTLASDGPALQIAFDKMQQNLKALSPLRARFAWLKNPFFEIAVHIKTVNAQILLQCLQSLFKTNSCFTHSPLSNYLETYHKLSKTQYYC